MPANFQDIQVKTVEEPTQPNSVITQNICRVGGLQTESGHVSTDRK